MKPGHLESLNGNEREALAALCGLEDSGKPVTAIEAARWLDTEDTDFRPYIAGLRRKGWISNGPRRGKATRLLIVARPMNIERQRGYRPAPRRGEIARHPDDVPAVRTCLSCGREFDSEGFGNRRCKSCKSSRASDESWMGEIEVWA